MVCGLVAKSCPTLCDPMDYNSPGFSVHGILQARILKWVGISLSRGSSQSRDWTWVSCIAGRFFTTEPPGNPYLHLRAPKSLGPDSELTGHEAVQGSTSIFCGSGIGRQILYHWATWEAPRNFNFRSKRQFILPFPSAHPIYSDGLREGYS